MENQFYTICRRCGRQILMTRCNDDGRWIPCDPVVNRFTSEGGPYMYINTNGEVKYGRRSKDGELGYKKHSLYCVLYRRNA